MLRLTPPDYTTIIEAKNFIANYGGGRGKRTCISFPFGK